MNEPVYESTPILPAEPKKSNTTIIVAIVVAVVVCCCCLCLLALGWQFGDAIIAELG